MIIINCPELESQFIEEYGVNLQESVYVSQAKQRSIELYCEEQAQLQKKYIKKSTKKKEKTVYKGKGRPRDSDYTAHGALRTSEKKKSKSKPKSKSKSKTIECPICYEKKSNYTTFQL